MNATGIPWATPPENSVMVGLWIAIGRIAQIGRAVLRIVAFALLYPLALADGLWLRVAAPPNGTALAHARAAWLHRWSRVVRLVLGMHLDQRGFTPVSGVVVASQASVLDAILIAAIRPCVFVSSTEMRSRPFLGLMAKLGGTIFVDRHQRYDAVRADFMIQRAVQRRLIVVIFRECDNSKGTPSGTLSSTLFQPASALGCTLTAAAIDRRRTTISFSAPAFRPGNRKQLACRIRRELFALQAGLA